jgi:hypothetical protein
MTISKDALLCVNQQKGKSVGKKGQLIDHLR